MCSTVDGRRGGILGSLSEEDDGRGGRSDRREYGQTAVDVAQARVGSRQVSLMAKKKMIEIW